MIALEQLLDDLQLYLPVDPEEEKIRAALEGLQLPDFVLTWDSQLKYDSTGDPVVRIRLIVTDDSVDRLDFTETLMRLRMQILRTWQNAGIERWPHVGIRTASEQRSMGAA